MGWDLCKRPMADTIAEIINGWESNRRKVALLNHKRNGNELWAVLEITEKDSGAIDRIIVLYLLARRKGGWTGYKAMDESMGPYYYRCPLEFLDKVPNVACAEWRQKVRQYWTEVWAAHKDARLKRYRAFVQQSAAIASL